MKKVSLIAAALASLTAYALPADQSAAPRFEPESSVSVFSASHARMRAPYASSTVHAMYEPPIFRLFYGMTSVLGEAVPPIEVYPPDVSLGWYNLSSGMGALTSTWSFCDDSFALSTSHTKNLDLSFPMSSLKSYRGSEADNSGMDAAGALVPAVSLSVTTAAGDSDSFASCDFMQIGGRAAINTSLDANNPEWTEYGLLPFSVEQDGLMVYTPDGVPIFGYSPESQDWLTNYTFNGHPAPDQYVYCNAVFNTLIPTAAPLTVSGARLYARGLLDDDAELRLLIYPTTADGDWIFTPVAEAVCPLERMRATADGDMYIYEIPFVLDEPVVLQEDISPYYLVGVTGFHESAQWFAPYMSARPNPYELALGYYRCTVSYKNEVDDWWMWHVANFEDGELYSSFAIALDASYPGEVDPPGTGGVVSPVVDDSHDVEYDILGRRTAPGSHGIFVSNGAKVLR